MRVPEEKMPRLRVRLEGETVWLSLDQMADLFQRDKSVISRHIKNVFEEGELVRDSVVADSATTAADGRSYQVEFDNLDVIISVGYRVKSQQGTQFRIWATQRLREFIAKGFTMDDERLKNPPINDSDTALCACAFLQSEATMEVMSAAKSNSLKDDDPAWRIGVKLSFAGFSGFFGIFSDKHQGVFVLEYPL